MRSIIKSFRFAEGSTEFLKFGTFTVPKGPSGCNGPRHSLFRNNSSVHSPAIGRRGRKIRRLPVKYTHYLQKKRVYPRIARKVPWFSRPFFTSFCPSFY